MADFKLDRIKFRWKGNWVSGNTYLKDDIVYYEGKAFVCLQEHSAAESFYTDFESAGAGIEEIVVSVGTDTLNAQANGKFYLDTIESPELNLVRGRTYEFIQNSSTNLNFNSKQNILLLSTIKDGELAGGPLYETGVTYRLDLSVVTREEYISGFATATDRRIRFIVPLFGADRIYYYSSTNVNLGNVLNTKYASNWEVMQDGYKWAGDWTGDTFYSVDNIVKFKGYLYKCTGDHTSGATSDGLTANISFWSLFATGYNWLDTWTTTTNYDAGDVVRNKGNVYVCVARHTSAATVALGLEDDGPSWLRVTRSDDWTQDWTIATKYVVNDLVKYGATVYRCVINHISAADLADGLELDQEKWEEVTQGVEFKGLWTATTRYKVGDIVKESATLYKCILGHTSNEIFNDDNTYPAGSSTKWEIYIPGLRYEELWSETTQYSKGDIVLYGGYSYVAQQPNLNKIPSDTNLGFWDLLKTGYKHRGEWTEGITYLTGDVVRNNGYLYLAIDDTTDVYPDSDNTKWRILVTGTFWKAEWADDVEYFLGDVVTYKSTAYICIDRHTSTASDSRPDLDLQQPDQDYWNILIKGDDSAVMANIGDIIIATDANQDSTVDKTELSIGLPGQVLKVSNQSLPAWSAFEEIPETYYVSTSGVDSIVNGKSLAAPFRTVKYACDFVNSNRGKTLELSSIIAAISLLAESGSFTTAPQLLTLLTTVNPNTSNTYADVTSSGVVNSDDATEFSRYVNYYIRKLGGTPPNKLYVNACRDLYNKIVNDFNLIKDEYFEYNSVTYNVGKLKNTTIFIKTGLYEEILPISVPAETALVGDELRSTTIMPASGYELSNMFFVRNGSGIRNMTLQGLYGELGEPNIYLTRRPTAGAFVSLDPGLGPTDKTVWITNKSPYIQNVTTFGTGCIGMKVDGALHNGGNDSIVANDFTQVISDGIGYWADNVGRSELVSVFTYYAHIGYLATNGGILRATNGNNSYGTYGSVAEGFDNTEIPITGTVNNRDNEALVHEIFTYGTVAQQILALGYEHAGQNYTSASITFNGAGFGASGSFTEFRNNAISNIRVISPGDSTRPGGLNYTFVRNNAQSGNTAQIRLSAADIASDLDYIGQRVVIISGLGVGQYAEITDYNSTTKIAIVSKETDGSSGWDHFQPGWPIEPILDETTVYLIEPKVTAEEPIFTTSGITASSADSWKYIVWAGDKYVALTGTDVITSASNTSGTSWSSSNNLSTTHTGTGIVYTGAKILVIGNPDSSTDDTAWQSTNGTSWSTTTLPFASDVWTSIASDSNSNVIILSGINQDVAISNDDGDSWSSASIGTTQNWNVAAYGNGKFIAIESGGNGDVAYSTNNGSTWTITSAALTSRAWTSGVYGNGRFVIIDNAGNTAISFNGIDWYEGYANNSQQSFVSYGAGVFIATGDSNTISKSQDGINWRTYADDSSTYATTISGTWQNSAFNGSNWVLVNNGDTAWNSITTGARAILRAKVESSRITKINIYDPGSLYTSTPTISIYDNQNTVEASFVVYKNNGVLAQPLMTNRGTGYTTATATVTGNGFAEIYQENTNSLVVSGISRLPGPGANLNISGINDVQYSISKINSFTGSGPYSAVFTITPSIGTEESPDHLVSFQIRERYSQVRLTGHDFLDIGTGNQNSTRYPDLYLEGEDAENARQPFNETVASGGGRVFYTSTDQDGNFRVGELFAVEQATGIVTINASQFDLSGLTELSLGGIQVGGSAVVIREFSKESTFVANSNNIVPTQKAIKTYIESRISGGGSNASTNRLVSGQIDISSRQITTTSGLQINVPPKVNLQGGIDGDYLALQFFSTGGAFGS